MLTFAQANRGCVLIKSAMKKFEIPKIPPEDVDPQVAVLLEFFNRVSDHANALEEEGAALRKELAQLKKAKRRAARSHK